MSKVTINNQTVISGITTKELIELFRPVVREVIKQEQEAQRKKFPPVVPSKELNSLTAIRENSAKNQNQ